MKRMTYSELAFALKNIPKLDAVFGIRPVSKLNTLYISVVNQERVSSDNEMLILSSDLECTLFTDNTKNHVLEQLGHLFENMAFIEWDESTKMYTYQFTTRIRGDVYGKW